MKVHDIEDEHTFSNGVVAQRVGFGCEVCIARDEVSEVSEFVVEKDGQQVHICSAHMQELLDADEDNQRKEDAFKEIFTLPNING